MVRHKRDCRFWVDGKAATKGSWTAVTSRYFKPSSKHLKPWVDAVKVEAKRHWRSGITKTFAVGLYVEVYLERPLSHFVGRNRANVLKTDAPDLPILRGTGDAGKFARAIEDAIEGIVYQEDCCVCISTGAKLYCNKMHPTPGAWIHIWVME